MFKRKLTALDYHTPDEVDVNDETQFRSLIVWLEDQKIRQYKVEDRSALRAKSAGNWEATFKEYLGELGYPLESDDRSCVLDWLLGYAIRLEYGDASDKYKAAASSTSSSTAKTTTNPLDSLDFNDPDFKAGVASLALMLQIPPHPDHLTVLKAICLVVKEKFSKEVIARLQQEGIKPGEQIPLDKIEVGFVTPDYITAEAAKVLRLLHVRELRELQNEVNSAVVACQRLTANPKTDTKLGKIGRS